MGRIVAVLRASVSVLTWWCGVLMLLVPLWFLLASFGVKFDFIEWQVGLELMINGVILATAGVWWFLAPDISGQVLLLVIIAAMTVEMAMGFAIATVLHRESGTDMTDMATELNG